MDYSIIDYEHTKTGEKLWLVKIGSFLGTDLFKMLLHKIKNNFSNKSFYYSVKRGFIIPKQFSYENIKNVLDEFFIENDIPNDLPKNKVIREKEKSEYSNAQIISVREVYNEYNKLLTEGIRDTGIDESEFTVIIDESITNGYKKGEYSSEKRIYFGVDVLRTDLNKPIAHGTKIIQGIFGYVNDDGDIFIKLNHLKRNHWEFSKFEYVEKVTKIDKRGKIEKVYLEHQEIYYLIDNNVYAIKSKDGTSFIPALKEGYRKTFVNEKQINAAISHLKEKGYNVEKTGRFGVKFTTDSTNIKELKTGFNEADNKPIDISKIINKKIETSTEKRLDLKKLYEEKKSPRKDVILREVQEGKMEYATYEHFDGMTDSYENIKVTNDSFKPAENSDRLLSGLRSAMGQGHWVYSAYVRYSSEFGYHIDFDHCYIRYKKSFGEESKKTDGEKEIPEKKEKTFSVVLDENILDFTEVVKHPKYIKYLDEAVFDADGKFYVKTKEQADILISIMNEIITEKKKQKPNNEKISDIAELQIKLNSYEVMLELAETDNERITYKSLIQAIKITIESI